MYGLVNKAVCDLITEAHGPEVWSKVLDEAGLDDAGFVSMDPYDDEVTYDLVGAASKVLDTPAADLLEAFGEYWVLFTAGGGYGDLLDLAGSDIEEFLENLDELHSRVALSFPGLQPPSFRLERLEDGGLHLHYHSERAGLTPMVRGLLRGLGKRFETELEVELVESRETGFDHDVFSVARVPAQV